MSPATNKKRLFLGVRLSVATTRKIAEGVERMRSRAAHQGRLRATWVPPTNLHATLKFLGWTNPEVVGAIRDAVNEGLRGRKAFDVVARGVGAFPNERSARVLWVGIDEPTGALARLATDVDGWMEKLGFERETRPFSAHVTLARVKEGSGAEELLAPLRDVEWGRSTIREVVLFESVMKSTGSEYTPLAQMALEADPSRPERQTREVEEKATQDTEDTGNGGPQSA